METSLHITTFVISKYGLTEALRRLPDDYRDVILMRNIEGLSHDEVALRMDRNVGSVRMLWVRALARLRDGLEESKS